MTERLQNLIHKALNLSLYVSHAAANVTIMKERPGTAPEFHGLLGIYVQTRLQYSPWGGRETEEDVQ